MAKHTSPISLFLTKESITRAPLPFTDTPLPHVISSHSTILFPQFQHADLHISRLSNVNSGSWKFYLKGKETLSAHLGNSRKSLRAIQNGSKMHNPRQCSSVDRGKKEENKTDNYHLSTKASQNSTKQDLSLQIRRSHRNKSVQESSKQEKNTKQIRISYNSLR